MKSIIKTITPCLAAILLGGAGISQATIVTVDGSITAGYMSVFNLDGSGGKGSYIYGQGWGISDIKSTVGPSSIVLEANYNQYVAGAGNPFWRSTPTNPPNSPPGSGLEGNKWMEASSFAGVSASSFTDNLCNFKAQVSAYTFNSGYTVRAFIKGFNANYSSNYSLFSDPLVAGSVVDLEFDTTGWVNIQYGFEVQGINANPDFSPGSATVIAAAEPPPLVYGIPNPGFEIPDGAQWAFDEANGHTVQYPATGGNPGGYAEIDATQATANNFGVLVSNGRLQLPLEALSLTAGQTYTFAMDMKVVTGTGIGGFKVDFIPSGSTGDVYPTPSSTPGEWSTYSFAVPIPANATGVKLVPLWGVASTVAYDNVRVAGPFSASAATVASDVKISWPTVSGRTYQVKKSNNLVNWAPFGASMSGNGSTFTVTDPIGAPGKSFFQVIETKP